MIQKTFIIQQPDGVPAVMDSLGKIPEERSILFVCAEYYTEAEFETIRKSIAERYPNLTVIGASVHNIKAFGDTVETHLNIRLSLLIFEQKSWEIVLSDMSQESEWHAAGCTREAIEHLESVKGVFLIVSGMNIRIRAYMERMNSWFPKIPFFGFQTATTDYLAGTRSNGAFLSVNGKICPDAIAAIILHGEQLHLETNAQFGWTPLGRKMTVTDTEGSNVVKTIDGLPAANIYKRYLGLEPEQIDVRNICEFPLFRMEKKRQIPRIGLQAFPDGSVLFGAEIRTGDVMRFSYGYPPDILAESEQSADNLSSFQPEAMFLISCMNRVLFLREEWEKEYNSFRSLQEETMVVNGNLELYMDEDGGGELASSLIYVALREGNPPSSAAVLRAHPVKEKKEVIIPLHRRLLTFLDVTTGELEELRGNLAEEVEKKTAEIVRQQEALNNAHIQIVMTLSNAIDAKDAYTNGHSIRVANYAREIARRYGYDEEVLQEVFICGLLHYVGKIGVPDTIINKPGRLTEEEFAVIKTHPSIGAEILSGITDYSKIAYGAHWHHERYDGKGYPDGLSGDRIPEIAQIISVADAYDAMTSNRSYRPVMEQAKVRSEIEKGRGTQFAPRFADIMLEMIDEDKEYMMRGSFAAQKETVSD